MMMVVMIMLRYEGHQMQRTLMYPGPESPVQMVVYLDEIGKGKNNTAARWLLSLTLVLSHQRILFVEIFGSS